MNLSSNDSRKIHDLYYFAKVVEAGGFAAAGRLLGIPKSRLSRRIAELEERLGARLLQRTTRQLKLTAVGERYLRHCQAMLLEAEMADEAVASMSSEPRGRLRVSCPVGLAHEILPGVISDFLERFPQVQLEVMLLNRRVDLVNEGIDVALRVRELGDEDPLLVTRRLRQAQMLMVASPGFLVGREINHPDDLKNLPVLGALEADRMVHIRMLDQKGKSCELALEARLGIDDFIVRKGPGLYDAAHDVLRAGTGKRRTGAVVARLVVARWLAASGLSSSTRGHAGGTRLD